MTDAEQADVFLKMRVSERVEYILAFNALEAAHTLAPGYEKALATQQAERRVSRIRAVMAEAALRPACENTTE